MIRRWGILCNVLISSLIILCHLAIADTPTPTPTPADTTPPTLSFTLPGYYLTTGSFTVSWSASDSQSGLKSTQLTRNSKVISTASSGSFNENLGTGTYAYVLSAYDNSNNYDFTGGNICVDLVKPTVSISSPTNGQVFISPDITITGNSSDVGSGVNYVQVQLNSDNAKTVYTTGYYESQVTLKNGLNTINCTAYDFAGWGSDTQSLTVTYTPPVFINPAINPLTINNLGDQMVFSYQSNSDGQVRISIEDTGGKELGVIQNAVLVSKDATQPYITAFIGVVQANNQKQFLDNGTYVFKAELKDVNGNSYASPVYFKSQINLNVTRQSVTSQIQTPANPSGARINIPNANLAFTMQGGSLDGVIMAQGVSGSTLQVPQIGSYSGNYQVTVSKPAGYMPAKAGFDPSSSSTFLCNTFRPYMPIPAEINSNLPGGGYQANVDSDGDGIPDGWEYQYWIQWQGWTPDCGCDLSVADGDKDKDQLSIQPGLRTTPGDGLTNLQEYQLQQKGVTDLDPRYIDLIVQIDWIRSTSSLNYNYRPSDLVKQTCSDVLAKAGIKVHWTQQGHEIINLPDSVLFSSSVTLPQLYDILNNNFNSDNYGGASNAAHVIHAVFAPGWTIIVGVSTDATTGAGGLYLQSPPGIFVFDLHTRNLETGGNPMPVANSSNNDLLDRNEGYILGHEIGHVLGLPDVPNN